MARLALAVAVALGAGCGRVGFTALGGGGGSGDGGATGDGKSGDGVAPVTCLASYELCDSFETKTLAAVWTPSGTVAIDTNVAHRGTQSMHFHTPALAPGGNMYSTIAETATFASADATFYVRAYVLIEAVPANNLDFIDAQQSTGSPLEDGLFLEPTGVAVYSQFANDVADTATPPVTGTWSCLMWQVTRATIGTGLEVLSGDQGMATLGGVQTDGVPAIEVMNFGIGFAGPSVLVAQPAFDLWLDDVIIASTALTCAD